MSVQEAQPLMGPTHSFAALKNLRPKWKGVCVLNGMGGITGAGIGIYLFVTGDWKKAVWPLGFGFGLGLNALLNWFDIHRTKVLLIEQPPEPSEQMIPLGEFNAQKDQFIEALNKIAASLEGKAALGHHTDYVPWARIQSAIAELIKPVKVPPPVDPYAKLQETLQDALGDVQQANSVLAKDLKTEIDPQTLGPRILPARDLGTCQQLWDDLDSALRMHQKLQLVMQMGASFDGITQSLFPLIKQFSIEPKNVITQPVPQKFHQGQLDAKWHMLTCFISAIEDKAQPAIVPASPSSSSDAQRYKGIALQHQKAAKEAKEKVAVLEAEKKQQGEMLAAAQRFLGENKATIKRLERELAAANEQHAGEKGKIEGQLEAAKQALEEAKQDQGGQNKDLEAARAEVARLQASLDQKGRGHAVRVQELSDQLAAATERGDRYKKRIEEEITPMVREKDAQIAALRAECNQKDAALRKEQSDKKDYAVWIGKIKKALDGSYQAYQSGTPSKDLVKAMTLPKVDHPFFELVSSVNKFMQTISQMQSDYLSGSSTGNTPVKKGSRRVSFGPTPTDSPAQPDLDTDED